MKYSTLSALCLLGIVSAEPEQGTRRTTGRERRFYESEERENDSWWSGTGGGKDKGKKGKKAKLPDGFDFEIYSDKLNPNQLTFEV